jgi:hypothetical protein
MGNCEMKPERMTTPDRADGLISCGIAFGTHFRIERPNAGFCLLSMASRKGIRAAKVA